MEDAESRVKRVMGDILVAVYERPLDGMYRGLGTHLRGDLMFDSLDIAELMTTLGIPDDDAGGMSTVGDIVGYLSKTT